ncbi:MAG: hypothetical protein P8K76_01695 [Candidatus Binatia bacterium]|nr:hypothetical protein [Candidatus Binatia bacterium]MDG1960253.1 hypothetical protein [Candidatus Binatia bacterium]MDG2008471.1 hypothetical protein [Candidatus Binatia bacterium]
MTKNFHKQVCGGLLLASMVLLGCAGARPAARETLPPDTRECLLLAQIHSTRAIGNREIVFRLYGGEEWTNQLPAACVGLGFNRGFTYDTSIHRLCRGQFIQTLEPGRSTCILGLFRKKTDQSP